MNMLRLMTTTLVALLMTGTIQASEPMRTWEEVASQLEELVPKLMEQHTTPGVSIAIVDNRKLVWARGFGVREAGTDHPVETNTLFEACSMSKPLFAYAALKLVEEGKLDLDRPLAEYLDKPYLEDQPLHEKITARMVLSHTTGFPNWRKGKPLTVAFEPGTEQRYSGEGFLYLQRVVEQIVDQPLEPWIQQRLLQPLGMNDSSYVWHTKRKDQAAAGHDKRGQLKPDRRLYTRPNSAYTLYTTPSDYARFLIEMLGPEAGSPHSLREETITEMLTPQVEIPDSTGTARGLGWAVSTEPSRPFGFHGGSNGTGFRCYSRFRRAEGTGIVIMTNSVSGAAVRDEIVKSLEETAW